MTLIKRRSDRDTIFQFEGDSQEDSGSTESEDDLSSANKENEANPPMGSTDSDKGPHKSEEGRTPTLAAPTTNLMAASTTLDTAPALSVRRSTPQQASTIPRDALPPGDAALESFSRDESFTQLARLATSPRLQSSFSRKLKPASSFRIKEDVSPPVSFQTYLCSQLLGPAARRLYVDDEVGVGLVGRTRVSNMLLRAPYQLERFAVFGLLLCFDAVLALFTTLPLRALVAALLILRSVLMFPLRAVAGAAGAGAGSRRTEVTPEGICDITWVAMIAIGVTVIRTLDISILYHYIRSQEVLKLVMVFNVLEVFEKLCYSFGGDALDGLFFSACVFIDASRRRHSVAPHLLRLVFDACVALSIVCVHTLIILAQAVTYNVAINSQSNQLLALLISNNFVEMKGNVFKKMDATKHFQMTCADVIERFHIGVCLVFVTVEMISKGVDIWSREFVWTWAANLCFLATFELLVDLVKHAFVLKFNDLAPGVFRDYMAEVCLRATKNSHHNPHRVLGFEPMGSACLLIRGCVPMAKRFVARLRAGTWRQAAGPLSALATVWLLALLLKLALGLAIEAVARRYVARHRRKYPHMWGHSD